MIKFKHKGDFSKLTKYLKRAKNIDKLEALDRFGHAGVLALESATPKDSGLTASSWNYVIEQDKGSVKIGFTNSNRNDGVPIAVIIQYGHATGNGGWVEGRDYINPAIQPVFDQIVNDVWKEVTKL